MNFIIDTEYPFWFVIFCLLLGGVYSLVLYYIGKKNEFQPWLTRIMAGFRFLCVTIIAFLLLSPLVKKSIRTVERPIIIVAQDNSQSIVTRKDSAFYNGDYLNNLNKFIKKLKEDYEVKTFTFGDKVNFDPGSNSITAEYGDKQTDIASLFDDLVTRYTNRNVGALILASDGIYNKGVNPVYSSVKFNSPIYTVALGDTTVQKDIILSKVNYNRISYLGNKFPVEIIINANKAAGTKSLLKVMKGSKVVYSKNINIVNDQYSETVNVLIEAKESGLQRYKVSLSPINNEITLVNNFQNIYVDILDGRQKILILANTPHPDISAIKQAIENNYNYEVDYSIITELNKPLDAYNLVILHQLPSTRNPALNIITKLNNSKTPILYIVGQQTNLIIFNKLNTGLAISGKRLSYNETQPSLNDQFTLFTVSVEVKNVINEFPPLNSPFGNYNLFQSANILFYQKIGSVTTRQPLIVFNQTQDIKTGIISGDGIWKWRLNNFDQKSNHDAFNELISKIVQYLSVKVDKSYFRVNSKNNFLENKNIEFDAEVYNESYELINEPEVNLTIINSSYNKFPFVFTKTGNSYHLDAGNFPDGNYRYIANVNVGGKVLKEKGEFSVASLNLEAVQTIADHQLMYKLAHSHSGEMIYPDQFDDLLNKIKERDDIRPVSYIQKRFDDLINNYRVLIFILILLAFEWFLRKRAGAY